MVYDEKLAARLRKLLPGATEKKMFGGMGLMERGHLVAGVSHNDLVVRVRPDQTDGCLHEPGAHSMMEGRTMQGWLKVDARALADDRVLRSWVRRSRDYAGTLPAK